MSSFTLSLPVSHQLQMITPACPRQLPRFFNRLKKFTAVARYSQPSYHDQESLHKFQDIVGDIVKTSINTGPRGPLRFAQGIQAVLSVGSEWVADLYKSENASSIQLGLGVVSPYYLRKLFEQLGATYIKLGQFIASTPTLFPPEYVQEFQNCFDKAPAVPFNEIEKILRKELGVSLDNVYSQIDQSPIASASIAQVHSAKLRSGEDVVIKILKPGIEDTLVADLNFIYIATRVLEFITPELNRTSVVGIVKDIRESMLEEVDLEKEAQNILAFRRYLESTNLTGEAAAPRVYSHCSTKRVLTMERLYGVPLTDLNSIRGFVSSPESTLITALNVWFGSLLACETFHADVHAGNLWLLRDGRVGFLDFGIVGRISPTTWDAIQVFLSSIPTENYSSMASALIAMGATGDNVDVAAFASDIERLFSSIKEMDTEVVVGGRRRGNVSANVVVDEREINALFIDVVRVSESYGIRFPREFALLMKQILYFDRYTRLLAPNLNMLSDQRISITKSTKRL